MNGRDSRCIDKTPIETAVAEQRRRRACREPTALLNPPSPWRPGIAEDSQGRGRATLDGVDQTNMAREHPPGAARQDSRGARGSTGGDEARDGGYRVGRRTTFRPTQPRGGLASISRTGWRSNAERLMTFSTSRRRRLLLQRLGELVVPLLQLREQAGVLDGDDGLVGERLQQRDLPICEWVGLVPPPRRPDRPPSRCIGTPTLPARRPPPPCPSRIAACRSPPRARPRDR